MTDSDPPDSTPKPRPAWLRGLLWGGGLFVALLLLATVAGALMEPGHVAVVRARYDASPAEVWAQVGDVGRWGRWNAALRSTVRGPDLDGDPVWAVDAGHGPITMRIAAATAPAGDRPGCLETVIIDDDLPFTGSWTWDVAADGDGTVVTLTEDGEVKNPLFRFLAYTVFGTTATADGYLRALGQGGFDQAVEPEVVRER